MSPYRRLSTKNGRNILILSRRSWVRHAKPGVIDDEVDEDHSEMMGLESAAMTNTIGAR
jgi:hypothetical protein